MKENLLITLGGLCLFLFFVFARGASQNPAPRTHPPNQPQIVSRVEGPNLGREPNGAILIAPGTVEGDVLK